MKKTIIIVSVLVFIASAYGQKNEKKTNEPRCTFTKHEVWITYRVSTLADAYAYFVHDIYAEMSKHLLKHFISTDTTYISNVDGERVEVSYCPDLNKERLSIELLYPHEVAIVNIDYDSEATLVNIIWYSINK